MIFNILILSNLKLVEHSAIFRVQLIRLSLDNIFSREKTKVSKFIRGKYKKNIDMSVLTKQYEELSKLFNFLSV